MKTIIDTNIFISFLIGKRLGNLKGLLTSSKVILVFAEQNIQELKLVTSRNKFRKYFPEKEVAELEKFIRITGEVYQIEHIEPVCRDAKDDFLLALAKKSNADYLVTGDADLLDMKSYSKTSITTIETFEHLLKVS